jgi:long-chain fatty acid transport protein
MIANSGIRLPAALAAAAALCPAAPARGSGLLVARFGGEHGHATTANPTAVYYNPAGLALEGGTRLMLDGTFAWRTVTYTRPQSAIDSPGVGTPEDAIGANSGEATLGNLAAMPFVGAASDLGVPGLGVGLAFFAPFGGAASWDGNDAFKDNDEYPGARDGVARWWSIDGTIRALYLSAAAAYRLPGLGLSFGLALNGIRGESHTVRARNGDGSDDLVLHNPATGQTEIKEGRSEIDVSGLAFGFGVGVVWEPAPDTYVGLSYQSRPNGSGGMVMEGTLKNALATAPLSTSDVEMTQDLADVVRLGFRTKVHPQVELRVGAEYAFWSALERQCILDAAVSTRRCEVAADGSAAADSGIILNLERRWEDAYGFKAGASYYLSDRLEAFAGAGYDGTAVPDGFMDPALFDLPKVAGSLGARYVLADGVRVTATLGHVYYFSADTAGKAKPPSLATPSTAADAGGKYEQAVSLLGVAVEAGF